jgi:DNA transformation protein
MSGSNKSLHDYLMADVFAETYGITSKRMFGGFGLYKNGKIFGLITDGKLFFKVGDTNRKQYEKRGSKPFVFKSRGRDVTISYWELPADIMEDKELLEEWIEESVKVQENKSKKR